MYSGHRIFSAVWFAVCGLVLTCLSFSVAAKSHHEASHYRYVVILKQPPVTAELGKSASNAQKTAYKRQLAASHQAVLNSLGKTGITPRHEYFYASNGFSVDLTPEQARMLRANPEVKSVQQRTESRLLTDAGPRWIGADQVWNGQAGQGAHRGERVVIGIIDGGIKPDHPSFAETASDGYTHTNPFSAFKGLCTSGQATCNHKLVGIYDFTDEGTRGVDSNGHGTHVASTAAGNPVTSEFQGFTYAVSGVAPRANIISYKACIKDNPNTPEENDDVCFSDDLLAAIDQSVADGVDIVNYSIGSATPCTPWGNVGLPYCGQYGNGGEAQAMLNARNAGVLYVVAAGNEGPGDGTIDYPGLAPWVLTVGNLTHDRWVASRLLDFSGGDASMPDFLDGVSLTEGIGPRRIVHARDYGNALCGTGEPELKTDCEPGGPDSLTGASNPFPPGTFNGEIVVCDRGSYGRVEKGFNVKQAGAGGYVLANTSGQAESVVADAHCLPATHVGNQAGSQLRDWLASGANHQARIQGQTLEYNPANGDIMNASSSRGPVEMIYATANATAEVRHRVNYMKPDIAAPGTSILAASAFDNGLRSLTGTSMATPHVTGAAALIKSAHPDFGPSELISALVLSAQAETVRKEDKATPAQARDRGAGRARVDRAVSMPLVFQETVAGFNNGNPQAGGQPERMNLPYLYSGQCDGACQFSRTVTNRSGRTLSWQSAVDSDNGLAVTVNPATFTLADGQSRRIDFTVDTSAGDVLGRWSEAKVVLLPDDTAFTATALPVVVFATAGEFPLLHYHSSSRAADRFTIDLDNLAPMTQATFAGWGPVVPESFVQSVAPDSTPADAFDVNGTAFRVFPLNASKKVLLVQTYSPSGGGYDVELYVGRDADIDDTPDESEVLCERRGAAPRKTCRIDNPTLGHYWVMVRNRGSQTKEIGAQVAFLGPDDGPRATAVGDGFLLSDPKPVTGRAMHVIGPAAFPEGAGQLLVTYQLPIATKALTRDQTYFAAVAVGGNENSVGETAIIAVIIKQTGALQHKFFSLNNEVAQFTVPEQQGRYLVGFMDTGPGAVRLDMRLEHLPSARINLYRTDFDFEPLELRPDVSSMTPTLVSGPLEQAPNGDFYASHQVSFDISDYPPGRWYAEVLLDDGTPNPAGTQEQYATLQAEASYAEGSRIEAQQSLWYNPQRDGWGADMVYSGNFLALTWYRYDRNNQPTWYQAAAPVNVNSNTWRAPVNHYTWDGFRARANPVASVATTVIDDRHGLMTVAEDDRTYSEPFQALLPANPPCPVLDGETFNLTGHWFSPNQPGYGTTTFVRSSHEDAVFYFYDKQGLPRWVIGNSDVPASKTGRAISMRQVREGFCPDCAAIPIEFVTIGTMTTSYDDDNHGHLSADLELAPPLQGHWSSSAASLKLSRNYQCQN